MEGNNGWGKRWRSEGRSSTGPPFVSSGGNLLGGGSVGAGREVGVVADRRSGRRTDGRAD